MSITDEIEKLASLLERGLITREDFDSQKARLFGEQSTGNPEPTPSPADDMLSGRTRLATTADPGLPLPQSPKASSNAPTVGVGTVLADRYIVTRTLGEGGMGSVYLAVDKDTEHEVALKMVSAGLADQPGMLSILMKEVATARKLAAHPNLLRILDIHLRNQPPFITMEAALGGDLHEYWLSHARKVEPSEVTRIITEVLRGLHSLHDARVVHQDIKPQNILFSASGSVKITDYGISKSIQEQVRTGGSDGAGTLAYMAPEQLQGQICDRRADLYAVGIMAHQLLTGRFPFTGTTATEVEAWHTTGSRALTGLPSPYDQVIAKMIAIQPEERFRTAQEVLEAIEPHQDVTGSVPRMGDGPSEVVSRAAQSGPIKTREVGPFAMFFFCTFGFYMSYLVCWAWPDEFNKLRGDRRYNQLWDLRRLVGAFIIIFTWGMAALYSVRQYLTDLEMAAEKLGLAKNHKLRRNVHLGLIFGWILVPFWGLGVVVVLWAYWVLQQELNRVAAAHNAEQA